MASGVTSRGEGPVPPVEHTRQHLSFDTNCRIKVKYHHCLQTGTHQTSTKKQWNARAECTFVLRNVVKWVCYPAAENSLIAEAIRSTSSGMTLRTYSQSVVRYSWSTYKKRIVNSISIHFDVCTRMGTWRVQNLNNHGPGQILVNTGARAVWNGDDSNLSKTMSESAMSHWCRKSSDFRYDEPLASQPFQCNGCFAVHQLLGCLR